MKPHVYVQDFDSIKAEGALEALTDFSSATYLIYKGTPMGFEYELLERFCKDHGLQLKMVIVEEMDSIIYMLKTGRGDIIAANFTVTSERTEEIDFTIPLMETRQILVQRLPSNRPRLTREEIEKQLVRNPMDLIGKTIYVRRQSAFYDRLQNLMSEIGGTINIQIAEAETEELIEMVAKGDIDYTIADENIALLNKSYYPNLDIRTAISFPQRIAWGVRQNSPELKQELDKWLKKFKKTRDFATIYMKYFKARTRHAERVLSEYSSFKGTKLSPYDELIKTESKRLGWDWKLLAALIYRESLFNPEALSHAGAHGLMQVIPETAERFGAHSLTDPVQNIQAGVSYLISLEDFWIERIPDSTMRTKFVLASYNVGLGHVLDAVRLTDKYGGDPMAWRDVASYLELKASPEFYQDPCVRHGYCRGSEPVNYVALVINHYRHFKNTRI